MFCVNLIYPVVFMNTLTAQIKKYGHISQKMGHVIIICCVTILIKQAESLSSNTLSSKYGNQQQVFCFNSGPLCVL